MANFEFAIPIILKHEGGWVSNPVDPGGETNFGISTLIIKREGITAAELGIDPATMFQPGYLKPMKVEAAKALYKKLFWDKYKYDQITADLVATKVCDCGINCGPSRGHAMAQKATNKLGQTLDVDGKIGPKTIAGINACDPKLFMKSMADEMVAYYTNLVQQKPHLGIFLKNWLKRAAWGV